MKILIVAIPSIHVLRWTSQLRDEGYEFYFLDIKNREFSEAYNWMHLIKDWRRNALDGWMNTKKLPKKIKGLTKFFDASFSSSFDKVLQDIKPDLVHSFNMNVNYELIPYMQEHPTIPWLCNTWGSDVYFYKNHEVTLPKIKAFLERLDFLFTDNLRDHRLCIDLGFKGEFLGAFPGGGGYEIPKEVPSVTSRSSIIVKGYDHRFGRALNVLKAIEQAKQHTLQHKIIVFSAHQNVVDYCLNMMENGFRIDVFAHDQHIPHKELLSYMNESLLYIGNSISDGMPNTAIEAIIMGAFPMQSNPGNVTSEIIANNKNGKLISNPEDVDEIAGHIVDALVDTQLLETAFLVNTKELALKFAAPTIKEQVIEKYRYLVTKLTLE